MTPSFVYWIILPPPAQIHCSTNSFLIPTLSVSTLYWIIPVWMPICPFFYNLKNKTKQNLDLIPPHNTSVFSLLIFERAVLHAVTVFSPEPTALIDVSKFSPVWNPRVSSQFSSSLTYQQPGNNFSTCHQKHISDFNSTFWPLLIKVFAASSPFPFRKQ